MVKGEQRAGLWVKVSVLFAEEGLIEIPPNAHLWLPPVQLVEVVPACPVLVLAPPVLVVPEIFHLSVWPAPAEIDAVFLWYKTSNTSSSAAEGIPFKVIGLPSPEVEVNVREKISRDVIIGTVYRTVHPYHQRERKHESNEHIAGQCQP